MAAPAHAVSDMAVIGPGKYTPFVLRPQSKTVGKADLKKNEVFVDAFKLDKDLVSNREYLDFVRKFPEWRKSKVRPLFADAHYLENWPADLHFHQGDQYRPVTHVSWFAAKAYCESLGKELPTTDQWEFAFYDHGRDRKSVDEKVLRWYGKPNRAHLAQLRSTAANSYGIYDMSQIVWEWTLDFNGFLAANELRGSASSENSLFCGAASLGTADSSDYVAFMRYSFRASLKASYTTANLGFRCAKDM